MLIMPVGALYVDIYSCGMVLSSRGPLWPKGPWHYPLLKPSSWQERRLPRRQCGLKRCLNRFAIVRLIVFWRVITFIGSAVNFVFHQSIKHIDRQNFICEMVNNGTISVQYVLTYCSYVCLWLNQTSSEGCPLGTCKRNGSSSQKCGWWWFDVI